MIIFFQLPSFFILHTNQSERILRQLTIIVVWFNKQLTVNVTATDIGRNHNRHVVRLLKFTNHVR